jgi:transcriptional regulator with XRE-family HTH domain
MSQLDVDPGFGPYLKSLRQDRDWSLRRLGDRVHISHQHVSDLEHGRKRPSAQVAELLDDALGAGGRLAGMVRRVVDQGEASGRLLADAVREPEFGSADVVLEHLHSQLEMLAAVDGRYGARAALVGAHGVIDVATTVARDVDANAGLMSCAARAAEFVGWLYRDMADSTRATHWYERAMEFAQAGGDLAMQGFVLMRKSQMAYESRNGQRVHMLARAALDGPWRLPDRLHAEALLQVARGNLMLGRSIDMHDVIERARDAAPDADLVAREATCWIEAGEPERAAELYEASIGKAGVSERDSGYYRSRQAGALAAAARPDTAAELAHEALLTSQRTGF